MFFPLLVPGLFSLNSSFLVLKLGRQTLVESKLAIRMASYTSKIIMRMDFVIELL